MINQNSPENELSSSNDSFEANWKKISDYVTKDNLSIIVVREKADEKHGAKTPIGFWKQQQKTPLTLAQLFSKVQIYGTPTAFVGGYGNLEIFDIDEKHWPGIAAMLFIQIKQLMPELWSVLRIHRTPSGGYHIIFKIADHPPEGNLKLAWKEGAKEAAIETRGTGGYALTDSSLNYTVHKDEPIPTISWLDRCSLKAICESFNQKIKVEAIKPKKEQSDFYDENPFEDFNGKDGGAILAEYGWKPIAENAKFIWYTRPGKTEGISASFNREKNIYFIFTSSSEFEPSSGYFPSMVLSKLQFNNDNKEVYRYLVEKGFGRVNKTKEIKFAENYAKQKKTLPNNFSEEAKTKYKETSEKIAIDYPYGEFIKYNSEDERTEVSREAFYNVAYHLGFRIHHGQILRIIGQLVHKIIEEREFYDPMKAYIKEDNQKEYEDFLNIYEKFIQKNGEFSKSRLQKFNTDLLIKDDRHNAYQFFDNCWIHITSEWITVKNWCDFDKLVYSEQVRHRDFVLIADLTKNGMGGVYLDYLEKTVGYNDYTASILGFLCHRFKDETTAYIIVLTEKCSNPKDGGGSGKNVWCNLLKNATTVKTKNCTGIKYDEKFFQSWRGERILVLSDLPAIFNYTVLKEASSGTITDKKLWKNEIDVEVEDTPKFICQTNYSVDIKDGGLDGRICFLEFSNSFTRKRGMDKYYGKHFPKGWTKEDWLGYDNVIASSIQLWIQQGCVINKPEMSATGWQKQFIQLFGQTIFDFINSNIEDWKSKKKISNKSFNKSWDDFLRDNRILQKYSSQQLNEAIDRYCKYHNIVFNKNGQWREHKIKVKGKTFGIVDEIDTED